MPFSVAISTFRTPFKKHYWLWDAQKDIFMAVPGAIIATMLVTTTKKVGNIYSAEELVARMEPLITSRN